MKKALIFDTELTDRNNGEIIEAAYMALPVMPDMSGIEDRIYPTQDLGFEAHGPGIIYKERYWPSKPISYGAMSVHHILPGDLETCPPSAAFQFPADTQYLIGHSIDTDWQAAGAPEHIARIDTHAIAQWLWPESTGYSLVALIYMLEGPTDETRNLVLKKAHSAAGDVELTFLLLAHILDSKPDIITWPQLWAYSDACRIPRTCPLKRWEGVLLEDMDIGAIDWCLRQHWIDSYFRKGLERALEKRGYSTHHYYNDDDCDDAEYF